MTDDPSPSIEPAAVPEDRNARTPDLARATDASRGAVARRGVAVEGGRGRLLVVLGLAVLGLAATAIAASLAGGSPFDPRPGAALPAPRFVEEAGPAGLDHAYTGEFDFYVGGGVAAFDCDANGLPDLYLAGGAAPAGLFRNRSTAGGQLAFEAVPDPVTDLDRVTGAYPIDIDGDRIADLVVLRHGVSQVLLGRGDCRFEPGNATLGLDPDAAWTAAFSATWEGDARLPTLAFGRYLVPGESPDGTVECAANLLVRPAAADTAGYAAPIALDPGWCSLSVLFSDWDRSGRRDLRISNDRHYYGTAGEEQLWRIAAGEPPRLYGRDDGWARLQLFGMGIASQDLTADGLPEVYLTSQGDNKLQTLAGGPNRPVFEDIALRLGATAHRPYAGGEARPSTAWHPAFEDVNNDGFVDLFVAKGNVEAQPEYAMEDPSNLLIGQPDGTFVEGAPDAGIVDFAKARGAAVIDLNGDGLLDLVTVVRRENVRLWRNVGAGGADGGTTAAAMGHWLGVALDDDGPNHDAIGAWVAVRAGGRTIEREVTIGGGHASGQLGPVHLGLGPAETAEVRVTWPDGTVGPWLPTAVDRVVRVTPDATAVEDWTPR